MTEIKIKTLLHLRKQRKRRKPLFVVKESHHGGRVKVRWRYPIGRHSGVRQQHKGKPALVRIGYGSPREVRGLHPSGLRVRMVHAFQDLALLNPAEEGGVLSHTVGKKNRLLLLREAQRRKITLLNVKDLQKSIQDLEEGMQAKKTARVEKRQKNQQKQAERAKKAAEKEEREKTAEKSHET